MRRFGPIVFLFLAVVLCGGCGDKAKSDDAGIRAGINEHLASIKTINLSAMDINVTNVSVQDNKAQAQVDFRPKTGGAGGDMQVSYALEKQNGKWSVVATQPTGGMTPQGSAGSEPAGSAQDGQPDFSNLLHGQPANGAALPPGHPPLNAHGGANPAPAAGAPQ